jgi:enamine deaminase RidA (YjgF/YER057c/UK114 family)
MLPVHPPQFRRPKGYTNGMIVQGKLLFVSGQIGWDNDGNFSSDDLVDQFGAALDNLLAVIGAANAGPEHIASMTIYVTDIEAYRYRQHEIGDVWRPRMGRNFPAMALVAVSALVEPQAKVEIQAVVELPA